MKIEGLKLTTATKAVVSDPKIKSRNRLLMQIDRQVQMIDAEREGRKPRGRWWWREDDGTFRLPIKFGKVALEIAKGKNAIVCDNLDEMVVALGKLRKAVADGEFDQQIARISAELRKRLKKE